MPTFDRKAPFQFLSAQPLIDDFRSGTFDDEDLAPYDILPTVLGTLLLALDFGEFDPWIAMSAIATAPSTLFGMLDLKAQNGGTFGAASCKSCSP